MTWCVGGLKEKLRRSRLERQEHATRAKSAEQSGLHVVDERPHDGVQVRAVLWGEEAPVVAAHFAATVAAAAAALKRALEAEREERVVHCQLLSCNHNFESRSTGTAE